MIPVPLIGTSSCYHLHIVVIRLLLLALYYEELQMFTRVWYFNQRSNHYQHVSVPYDISSNAVDHIDIMSIPSVISSGIYRELHIFQKSLIFKKGVPLS